MEELRALRPQVTITVKAKKRRKAQPPPIAAESGREPAPAGAPTTAATQLPRQENGGEAGPGGMRPHPDPELVEKSKYGLLPIVDKTGRAAWRVYARPFTATGRQPRIAVVIVDLGLSVKSTGTVIRDLPGAMSLAFHPFARGLKEWVDQARNAGHEVLLNLPMEPADYPVSDPGPRALMTSLAPEDNLRRLQRILGRSTGYVGLASFMGSKFLADAKTTRPVLEELKNRGLMFLATDGKTRDVIAGLAAEIGVPHALSDGTIDAELYRGAIDRRLAALEETASKRGYAVAIAHPYPITINRLKRWAAKLEAKGMILAPVSAVAKRPGARKVE